MMGGFALDSSGSGYRHMAGYCEQGNYPLGSMKCRDFPYQLRNDLFSEDFAPCRYFVRWNQTFSDHNYSNNAGCHGWNGRTCIFPPFSRTFHSLLNVTGIVKVAGRQRCWEATYRLHSHSVNSIMLIKREDYMDNTYAK
jgi:hypothetical protein